jgi:alkaline phosphatase D
MFNRRQIMLQSLTGLAAGGALLTQGTSTSQAEDSHRQNTIYLAMGFRVGEVTQTSAIVWTRVTAVAEPNWQGKAPVPLESKTRTTVINEPIPIEDREGAVPGAPGEVRVVWSTNPDSSSANHTDWVVVRAEQDFTHKFFLENLQPRTKYFLQTEARAHKTGPVTRTATGSFATPAARDEWQDVQFAATTCQMYYHRDLPDGFQIYRSMANLGIQFLASTGDSVYYDRDNPRANTVDLCRFHWNRIYSLPRLVEFFRTVPAYWEKDDHDTYFDDCWPECRAPWIEPLTYAEGVSVYREQVPIGESLFRTIRWGAGLQVWFVEVRDFRSPNDAADGPQKSIWGQQQKEWLQRTILDSDASFRILISPTAIVGRDNPDQRDNHANINFAFEGNEFRQWTRRHNLRNLYVIGGDRHWQYMSTDPATGLREFACGPASDAHAFPGPGYDPLFHSFYRSAGGFLSVAVTRTVNGPPMIAFRFHDVQGKMLYEYRDSALQPGRA